MVPRYCDVLLSFAFASMVATSALSHVETSIYKVGQLDVRSGCENGRIYKMGAWGLNIFSNDAALDFLHELRESTFLSDLAAALALRDGEYIQDDEGVRALIAAEIIASARDGGVEEVPERIRVLLADLPKPILKELAVAARVAVSRVLMGSETTELRAEAGAEALVNWKQELEELMERLS